MARGLIVGNVLVVVTFVGTASAEQSDQGRLQGLEERVTSLEAELNDVASGGGRGLPIRGVLCAVGTRLWPERVVVVFSGCFFNVITVLVFLAKNAGDKKATHSTAPG